MSLNGINEVISRKRIRKPVVNEDFISKITFHQDEFITDSSSDNFDAEEEWHAYNKFKKNKKKQLKKKAKRAKKIKKVKSLKHAVELEEKSSKTDEITINSKNINTGIEEECSSNELSSSYNKKSELKKVKSKSLKLSAELEEGTSKTEEIPISFKNINTGIEEKYSSNELLSSNNKNEKGKSLKLSAELKEETTSKTEEIPISIKNINTGIEEKCSSSSNELLSSNNNKSQRFHIDKNCVYKYDKSTQSLIPVVTNSTNMQPLIESVSQFINNEENVATYGITGEPQDNGRIIFIETIDDTEVINISDSEDDCIIID